MIGTYYASSQSPKVNDRVQVFSNSVNGHRFLDPTIITEVDAWGNVRIAGSHWWYGPKHFSPAKNWY